MKKFVLAMFVVLLMAGVANANVIGIFGDMDATTCEKTVPVYAPQIVYFLAVLDDIPAITAAEFGAVNFPESLGYPVGTATISWNTDLVIGNIYEGVALAFGAPLPGPIAYLGECEILDFGGYAFDNHMACIVANAGNPEATTPLLVDDAYETYEATGWCLVFNCTTGLCDCMSIPVEEGSFSSIKALY